MTSPTRRSSPQNAWDDKVVEVSDVVEHPEVAITRHRSISPRNTTTTPRRSAALTLIPYKTAVLPFHIWNSLVEKAGFKMADAPKTWDAFWDFFKPMQAKAARHGHAQRLLDGSAVHHDRPRRRQQHVQPFPDRQWRQRHRDQGRQGPSR